MTSKKPATKAATAGAADELALDPEAVKGLEPAVAGDEAGGGVAHTSLAPKPGTASGNETPGSSGPHGLRVARPARRLRHSYQFDDLAHQPLTWRQEK